MSLGFTGLKKRCMRGGISQIQRRIGVEGTEHVK